MWPRHGEGAASKPLRVCYPSVALRGRAVYFFGISDIEEPNPEFKEFNTVISAVMELVNESYRLKDDLYGDPAGAASVRFATATAGSLIFPFAPHLGSEVYERLMGERVWEQPWPQADLLTARTVQ